MYCIKSRLFFNVNGNVRCSVVLENSPCITKNHHCVCKYHAIKFSITFSRANNGFYAEHSSNDGVMPKLKREKFKNYSKRHSDQTASQTPYILNFMNHLIVVRCFLFAGCECIAVIIIMLYIIIFIVIPLLIHAFYTCAKEMRREKL